MTDSKAMPRLAPHGKITIPEAFTRSSTDSTPAPASERKSPHAAAKAQAAVKGQGRHVEVAAVAEMAGPTREILKPISPGLSNVSLPLGPRPKGTKTAKEELVSLAIYFLYLSALSCLAGTCSNEQTTTVVVL